MVLRNNRSTPQTKGVAPYRTTTLILSRVSSANAVPHRSSSSRFMSTERLMWSAALYISPGETVLVRRPLTHLKGRQFSTGVEGGWVFGVRLTGQRQFGKIKREFWLIDLPVGTIPVDLWPHLLMSNFRNLAGKPDKWDQGFQDLSSDNYEFL